MPLAAPRGVVSRRAALTATATAAVVLAAPDLAQQKAAASQDELLVSGAATGPPGAYRTIGEALAASGPSAVITIAPGTYTERLVLDKAVTLRAAAAAQEPLSSSSSSAGAAARSGSPAAAAAAVILVWETQQPYQSTLECAADGIVVEGLTIRHYSKSVANNYGVFVRDGSARLSGCDVSSRSGVGIGVEGACAVIDGCDVHDCERHGIAIFGGAEDGASSDEPGPLSGGGGTCVTAVRGCSIRGNKGNGMLVRDGAAPTVEANRITGNREYGVQVQDSSGRYGPGNNTGGNGKGDISIQGYFEGKVLPALSGSVGKA